MKRSLLTQVLVLSASLLPLSLVIPLNSSSLAHLQQVPTLVADGVPLPPPGPRPAGNSVTDGVPLPPPGPRPSGVAVTDGVPLPPPGPRPYRMTDGVPLPPPGPRPNSVSSGTVSNYAWMNTQS
jgi:hypothetical protein